MPRRDQIAVYQFKVVLRGVSPMIWRRLLMRSDHTVADLHYAIQIAMGWNDSHLNRFHIHGRDYGVAHPGGISFHHNPHEVTLASFQFRTRERFLYEYNFNDSWEHDVRLEKVLPVNVKSIYPVCVSGQRPAPPEECGGARVFMEYGDPRWERWWREMPRKEMKLIADTIERGLDSKGEVKLNRKKLQAAVERIEEHRLRRPDRLDRRLVNERLRQYARGERQWLFCEIIGE